MPTPIASVITTRIFLVLLEDIFCVNSNELTPVLDILSCMVF